MLTKTRVVHLLFMLVVLLSLFFWRTFDISQENEVVIAPEQVLQSDLLRCDYLSACEFLTEQGSFFLSIKNVPIKAEEWIDFELQSPIKDVQISKAKIVSKSMFMGRIPVTFKPSGTQQFSAKSLVGACTTPEMIWSLEIIAVMGGKSEVLSFDFMVKQY